MSSNGHSFFEPLWRRIAVVALCFVWAAVELAGGQSGWAMLALAVGAYGVWSFLIAWKPARPSEPPAKE